MMKTDKHLKDDILAELRWESSVNAEAIGVEVKDGIVTLAGHVSSYAEKWAAEQATQRVAGVRALAVEIDVKLLGLSKRTDGDIAGSAENVLQWTTSLPKDSVKVLVEDGWITLSGEAQWDYQRRTAVAAVRNLMGVRGISDNIVLKSKVSANGVKADITEALKRRAIDDSQKINVEVNDADVTLSGKVGTWAERELARHSAWNTAGVTSVHNNIIVSL